MVLFLVFLMCCKFIFFSMWWIWLCVSLLLFIRSICILWILNSLSFSLLWLIRFKLVLRVWDKCRGLKGLGRIVVILVCLNFFNLLIWFLFDINIKGIVLNLLFFLINFNKFMVVLFLKYMVFIIKFVLWVFIVDIVFERVLMGLIFFIFFLSNKVVIILCWVFEGLMRIMCKLEIDSFFILDFFCYLLRKLKVYC